MSHQPIILKNISVYFPHKTCFEHFSKQINYGSRIAIIGKNGSGKSTLLKIIQGLVEPSQGQVHIPHNTTFGYVPQVISNHHDLSGGQRLNAALTAALAKDPSVLCLDEPTNHLDASNRKSLMRMLQAFHGTLIVVSHDVELLRTCVDEIWHIDDEEIACFTGQYDDYVREQRTALQTKIQQRESLDKAQRKAKSAVQAEQKRAAGSQRVNAYENDKVLRGAMKEKGARTAGKKVGKLNETKEHIDAQRKELRLPEIITPKFSLTAAHGGSKFLVTITNGACGYKNPVLTNIHITIGPGERVAILGDNGSGKSTLFKAIQGDALVIRSGEWHVPKQEEIGYLGQHYDTLPAESTVFEIIQHHVIGWTDADIRRHLNDFLFRKNEEVMAKVKALSGGEKARLSLALIAAKTPRLLLLDEITNNVDLETREHIIEVLKEYPGAIIVISHDQDFLTRINIDKSYSINDEELKPIIDF